MLQSQGVFRILNSRQKSRQEAIYFFWRYTTVLLLDLNGIILNKPSANDVLVREMLNPS
jgi:hypothetical protein